jgi:amidophosphoribosyltransferase
MTDECRECCGLFGVWGDPDASRLCYLGLYSLQHRGQESAGIASVQKGRLVSHRGMGLVPQVFKRETLARLDSTACIGHTRYSTTGNSDLVNAQPLVVDSNPHMLAVAHNGNLVNSQMMRRGVLEGNEQTLQGVVFHTTSDTEIILHLVARHLRRGLVTALKDGLKPVRGAYSLLFLTPTSMVGVRDPSGFRPLVLGRKGAAHALASESCALDACGYEPVRDVEPGEIVLIDDRGAHSERLVPRSQIRPAFCMFEFIYFARPDSSINGDVVHEVRKSLGRRLAKEFPAPADVVTPIPDSGNAAAQGYAEEACLPFDQCFVRNHYVGRTFIQPVAEDRRDAVGLKLSLVKEAVRGKRVVVVDDSIVRGTTVRSRIRLLREAGAKEVHMRASCPPLRHPCFYGIDFPTREELIATDRSVEEIRKFIGADTLGYLSLEGMLSCVRQKPEEYCTACWSGNYPVEVSDAARKHKFEC